MSDLKSLIERCEKATGPDRELDAELWLALTHGATRKATFVNHWKSPYTIDETRDASGVLIIVPAYSSDIDHAVTVTERYFPDCAITVTRFSSGRGNARIWQGVWSDHMKPTQGENGSSPALALCLALLRALDAAKATEVASQSGR